MTAPSAADALCLALNALAPVSRLFWEPDPELCAHLAGAELAGDLLALERGLGGEVAVAARTFREATARQARLDGLCDRLASQHLRLFVNAREGVAAPPYESVYQDQRGLVMGPAAVDMGRRLEALGLEPARLPEPPDHLAMELEFLYLLWEGVAGGGAAATPGAREFAARLAGWLPALVARLEAAPEPGLYLDGARLALELARWLAGGP